MQKPVAIIDIDGILTDYPNCFLYWVSDKYGTMYESIEKMQDSMTIEEYNSIKHEYRISGVKATLPVKEDALRLLELLNDLGYYIWIVSSRPFICREDTISFLDLNCIPFNRLTLTPTKRLFIKKIMADGNDVRIIIDDNMQKLVI